MVSEIKTEHVGGCNERCNEDGHWLEGDPAPVLQVRITEGGIDTPVRCEVWRDGRLVFFGQSDHEAQIRDLRMGSHPAGRALRPHLVDPGVVALAEALTERDAEHEGGGS